MLLYTALCLHGQEEVLLEGRILNDTIDKSGLNIVNINLKKGTITNHDGQFEIKVRLNDTIYISSIQYETKKLIINNSIFNKKKMTLYLVPKINTLDEVIVSNRNLSGDLKTDILNTKMRDQKNFYDFGIPGYRGVHKERIPSTYEIYAITPLSIRIDIEAMFKQYSGYYKKLRQKRKLKLEFDAYLKLYNKYSVAFLNDVFEIPISKTNDFLFFCIENTDIIEILRAKDNDKILLVFEEQALAYSERGLIKD